jgi:ABC-type polysaccharide/polyol phosphate transport system ATPase subunit
MNSASLAVRADKVSKTYRLYDSPSDRLKELIFRRPRSRAFHALSDISFALPRGRALGLIGENGAGKSTLLKIVAGTTQPTSGDVVRQGAVASILELGMGFHPEFSGQENARLNAALLGLSGSEIRRRLPQIRDFAELGDFFDRPVRTYSSGMALRLAFAVATHVDAEILIIDEALAVGDGYFQKKSIDRITDFHKRGGTLLFCSHALYYVAMLCDSAIWLREGREAASGEAVQVVRKYESFLQEKERRSAEPGSVSLEQTEGRRPALLTEVVVHDGSGYPRSEFGASEAFAVDLAFHSADPNLAFHVRVGVDRHDGVQAFAMDTCGQKWAPVRGGHNYRIRLSLPELPLSQGDFKVYAFLTDEKALHLHDMRVLDPGFTVVAPDYTVGMTRPRHNWSLLAEPREADLAAGSMSRVSASSS